MTQGKRKANPRAYIKKDAVREYVLLYGDRSCVVTGRSDDAMLEWAHLDDRRDQSSFLNLLRLESGLNKALEVTFVSRLDLPPELAPEFLVLQSHRWARQGRFGAALGCARLASYVACPRLRRPRRGKVSPFGDLRLGLQGSTRALANARVLGRCDVARDILKRDILPIMGMNASFGDLRAEDVSQALRQVGGFFRDKGELRNDHELSEIVDRLEDLEGTRLSESVGLRNSAIRDILIRPKDAAETLSRALDIALNAGGTEPRAQKIWRARAESKIGDLDKSSQLIADAMKGAGAPISPDFPDLGYRRGSQLGSLTWQSMIEGLLIQADTLRRIGGRKAKDVPAFYAAAYYAIAESGVTPTDALGDDVTSPFYAWCQVHRSTPPVRQSLNFYFRYWTQKFIREIDRQFG